jgi:serine/threonine-protein kinase
MASKPILGEILGHYRLLDRIGEGGMGVVYRARDEQLQREVALKLLPHNVVSDDSARRRFRHEAVTLARLNHPNIATLHGFETDSDVDFLVMEYVSGVSLSSKLARGPLRESELLDLAIQLSGALEEAHKNGVIHRDLKPANILISSNGQLKMLDFGLARLLTGDAQTDTATGRLAVSGTLPYVAPEQLSDTPAVDSRSDLYSCGVVLYEMATGRRAHAGDSVASLLRSILEREPASVRSVNPTVSPELEAIIRKAMDKDPGLRYQSARELKVDLQRLISGKKFEQVPLRPRRRVTPRWVTGALATVLVLLAALEVATLRWKARSTHPVPPNTPRVVAVLPFDAVGGNRDNQVLCRGLTDLLTTRLTQMSSQYGVQVVPASEVRTQGVSSIGDARKKLGVNLVVEGSWDFAGNQVMYGLVDATTRRSVSADFVKANLDDLLSVERRVADGLLSMVAGELRPHDQKTATPNDTAHPDAYQYYVRGIGYLQEYQNVSSLEAAVALFHSATERDPSFAPALAGTAEAYWRLYEETKDESWLTKATEAAHHAQQLNDQVAPVHVTLGLIDQGTSKYADAIKEFQRAAELDSSSDAAYRGLAASYDASGKTAEAEAAYKKAIEMRKDYWGGYSALGVFYARKARYDEAAAQFRRVVELVPENVRGYSNLSGVYLLQGKTQEAEEGLKKSLSIEPNYRAFANLGTLYFSEDRYTESAASFEKALELNDRDGRVWRNLGDAYYWAGTRDKATPAYQHGADLLAAQIKISPRDPNLMVELALCDSMLGKRKEAADFVRRAHSLSPSDPQILFRSAEVYEQNGDHEAALNSLEQAIRQGYSISDIQHDPTFQGLREQRRYKELVQHTAVRPNS